jgi:hypothetical protein
MDKDKYLMSDTEYLDLAKLITNYLSNLYLDDSKEYSISTVLASTSIGVYMFLKEIASNLKDVEAIDLYNNFDSWVKWADSKFNKES